eukprot:9415629-Prorocentrum_lima.AAC.1
MIIAATDGHCNVSPCYACTPAELLERSKMALSHMAHFDAAGFDEPLLQRGVFFVVSVGDTSCAAKALLLTASSG